MPKYTINFAQQYPHTTRAARQRRAAGRFIMFFATITLYSVMIIDIKSASVLGIH